MGTGDLYDPAGGDGAARTTPSRSAGKRWLRHLGFSAPILASLAAALLVAGSFTVMRWFGEDEGARAVPLDRTDIDVDRPVDPALGRIGTVIDELRRRGHIGDEDTLSRSGRERRLGDRVLTRAQQEHQGIPVFAGDVVVTTEGERIVQVHGHPVADIDLDTTVPANDYPATVTLAEALLGQVIAATDDGTLVIVAVEGGGYRLAWLGVVVIDEEPVQVALDAETGAVLHRAPIFQDALGDGMQTGAGGR